VLVDVERDTMNINVHKIEEKISPRTRAIITVDFGGQPADYDEIRKIARRHKLFIVEDAAHTLPSAYQGKKVGGLADITCFSFYATKTLNTGEGGMITTGNEKWAQRMKMMRLHGMSEDVLERSTKKRGWFYEIVDAGFKYNTTDINAAMGMAQLDRLEWMWERRAAVAASYTRAFKKMPEIILPVIRSDRKTSWHLYVLKLNLGMLKIGRDQFIRELAVRGIGTGVHFIPLYRHPFYRDNFKLRSKCWPDSEWLYERILSLPIYPGLTKAQISHVIASVRKIVSKFRK
jgi:perosamine synthetase